MQRDMAALHDGAYRYREMLAAEIALEQARTMAGAIKPLNVLSFAAARAERALRPTDCFKVLTGSYVIREHRAVGSAMSYLLDLLIPG